MGDRVGMGVMIDMLLKSLTTKGRIKDWVQFDTLQKMRSTYTKAYQSSPARVKECSLFTQGRGRVRPTSCPAQ